MYLVFFVVLTSLSALVNSWAVEWGKLLVIVWKYGVLSEKGKPLTCEFQLPVFHSSVIAEKRPLWITIKGNMTYAFMSFVIMHDTNLHHTKLHLQAFFLIYQRLYNCKMDVIFRDIIWDKNASSKRWPTKLLCQRNPFSNNLDNFWSWEQSESIMLLIQYI